MITRMEHLDNIPTEQFFKAEHFDTFTGNKVNLNNSSVLAEREVVRERLLELDDELFPAIQKANLDLHRHNRPEHYTSGIDIDNPFIPNTLRSIWLHYGKSSDEIKAYQRLLGDPSGQTFIHHIRMQFIIYNHESEGIADYGLGTWLVIGKNDGSVWDREHYANKLTSERGLSELFELISNLPTEYFITCMNRSVPVHELTTPEQLRAFTKERGDYSNYFIIGRAFEPEQPEMSATNIAATVLGEFQRMMPLYEAIRHRL